MYISNITNENLGDTENYVIVGIVIGVFAFACVIVINFIGKLY